MTQFTFGLSLPQRGIFFDVTTIPLMLEMAAEADSSGLFDSIWVGDSVLAKPRPESLTLLAALAAITTKVKLGTGCMASFPIRDPLLFAYQWANLDLISNGRMLLAVCTGIVSAAKASALEGGQYGIADKDRAAYMEENMTICRRLWSEDNVTFKGKYHSLENVTLLPRPVQQPCPIWIAANPFDPKFVSRAMRRVAETADGWMTTIVWPGLFQMLYGPLCQALQEAGKDPAAFPNILYHNINITPDGQAGLEETQRFLDNYYGKAVFSAQMTEAWTISGPPQHCIDELRKLRDAGAKSITLRLTSWQQKDQYQKLINEVLPLVNQG